MHCASTQFVPGGFVVAEAQTILVLATAVGHRPRLVASCFVADMLAELRHAAGMSTARTSASSDRLLDMLTRAVSAASY
jgi:hypothetical protein